MTKISVENPIYVLFWKILKSPFHNLGTGHGYSVLDVVHAFEKVNGVKVPYSIKPRRPGDIATCYCNPAKALEDLGWKARYGIEEMCRDAWNWQKNNPNGYEK